MCRIDISAYIDTKSEYGDDNVEFRNSEWRRTGYWRGMEMNAAKDAEEDAAVAPEEGASRIDSGVAVDGAREPIAWITSSSAIPPAFGMYLCFQPLVPATR